MPGASPTTATGFGSPQENYGIQPMEEMKEGEKKTSAQNTTVLKSSAQFTLDSKQKNMIA